MLSFAALPASLASPIINSSAVFAVVPGGVLLDEDALRVRPWARRHWPSPA